MNKLTRHPLPVILFTIFIDLLGFGILIPVIPLLLADPRSPYYLLPAGFTVSQGYILLGFLTAIFPFMQFLAAPILGQLSDKFGRKPILAVSLMGTCLSYIFFAIGIITKNIPILFLARAFDGITGGNISVAQAAIADVSTPENRAKNFGFIGAVFGLGFIIGPYIGGKFSDPSIVSWFSAATPFWFAAILSFINVLSVIFMFPETHRMINKSTKILWNKSIHNIARAYTYGKLRVVFITVFLFSAGFSFFVTFFAVFLINKFGFNQGNIGDYFAFVGIWIAITQALITGFVAKRLKSDQVVKFAIIGTGVTMLMYFLPTIWWHLLLIVPFFAVFNGLAQANITALVSNSVDNSIQGEILGINTSIQALAQAVPPALSGYIAASLTAEAPVIVAAVVIIISGFTFLLFYKPIRIESVTISESA